jgi:serine protease Do
MKYAVAVLLFVVVFFAVGIAMHFSLYQQPGVFVWSLREDADSGKTAFSRTTLTVASSAPAAPAAEAPKTEPAKEAPAEPAKPEPAKEAAAAPKQVDEITLFDGKDYQAEIVGRDPSSDIALLKIRASGLPFVKMVESQKSRVGDWVIAIGNPLGLGNTVTAGIISALQRNIGAGGAYDRFIQTDTAINPGNSGGPLFNLKGEVVGINNRLISPVGANIGVGFAIPAEEAIPVIESLKKGVRPERGYLGISIQPVSEDLADALGLEKNRGEFVARIVAGEAADKAGLKEGDIVLRVDNREVTPDVTLSYIVANIKPGTRIPLDILREGKPMTLTATVGARPPEEKLAQRNFNPEENKDFDKQTDTPDSKVIRDALGLSVIPLDAEIARALGMTADIKGVVIDVPGAGTAAQVGLRRGDVIVSANYRNLSTASALAAAIKDAQTAGRGAILLGVKRRGAATQYVTVRLED